MLKVAMKDMGAMFKWFEKDRYAVDIKKAREECEFSHSLVLHGLGDQGLS